MRADIHHEKLTQPAAVSADSDLDLLRQQVDAATSLTLEPLKVSLAIFLSSLARLPHATIGQRRAIYEAIQTGQKSGLTRIGAEDALVNIRYRQLRMIMRYLEQDIRAGVDVLAEGFHSTDLERDYQRLEAGYALRVAQQKSRAARAAKSTASTAELLPPQEASSVRHWGYAWIAFMPLNSYGRWHVVLRGQPH